MRGAIAKQNVEDKIREAFGKDFIGVAEKKLYVQADDGGELVQVCITLTCPKVPLSVGSQGEGGIDFDNMPTGGTATEFKPAEVTKEETENIRKLLQELGL